MIDSGQGDPTNTHDEELLADLFDVMLQEILEGRTPELADYHPERPDLQARITKAWSLACSVAGRREPSRPVLGGYEILRELGHGGMGTVYLARHQVLQREVAIKVLPQSLAMSPRAKQRFLDEARSLARVRHENIVHIHRVLDHSEMLAFEMELIDGPSLQHVVQTLRQQSKPHTTEALANVLQLPPAALGARTTVEWTVRLGIKVARALAEVHRIGLVHRDVKPSNILLRSDGRPVLADFGLARDDDDAQGTSFAGTAVYAAPERLRGGDAGLDGRADVYSLGVTLCECLTQRAPYPGQTTEQVLRQIEAGRFVGLRHEAPHVSRDLDTVIGKAMEPDPRHRYATADELADDLERVLNFEPVRAQPASAARRVGKFLRRHRRIVLAATAGALVVFAGLWPVLRHLANIEGQRAASERALLAARTAVMSPENLHATWARSITGATRTWLREASSAAAQTTALRTALRHYDEALAVTTSQVVQLERDVIATTLTVLAPRTEPLPEVELRRALDPLPPLTAQLARRMLVAGKQSALAIDVKAATPTDCFAAGYLSFLLGDVQTATSCWHGLDKMLPDAPLLDACAALLLANDGYPERAYPRLFHAAKEFPGSSALALALTDAALVMGDLQLAENWLNAVPDRADQPFAHSRRELLRADLHAVAGELDTAAATYRRLARDDSNDPLPMQRLAELAVRQGDWPSAGRQFQNLLHRWPDHSHARLELARLALIRRDRDAYLQQAQYVLALDRHAHSPGSISRFAEILRLGGLDELRAERFADVAPGYGTGARSAPIPLSSWLPPHVVHAISDGLRIRAAFDASLIHCRKRDARELPSIASAAWLTSLRLPQILWRLPPRLRIAAVAIPPLIGEQLAERIAVWLTPFERSLGAPLRVVNAPALVSERLEDSTLVFGARLATARDLDGDTLRELIVACPVNGTSPRPACVQFRSLSDGSLLRTIENEDDALLFARSIAVLGDADGDYCDDLLIGAPRGRKDGSLPEVQLRSGRTGERIWTATWNTDAFGVDVAALGDVDDDGCPDLIVGASAPSLQRSDRGRAFVLSGRTGAVLRELVAEHGNNWFGGAVASAGDVDGDGNIEVIVGGNYGNAPGLVQVMKVTDGSTLFTFADDDRASHFGAQVLGVGDVLGDHHVDWVISAPGLGNPSRPGRVIVVDGATGKVGYELLGDQGGDGFGTTLCALADWRRDGRPALAVGSRRGGPSGSGYVRVFDARTGAPLQTIAGNPHMARFGFAIADLGDRDGDGFRELAIAELDRRGVARVRSMSFAMLLTGTQRR